MTEKPVETARSIHDRVHAEMLDSFDEELELEIDDDRLDALTNEFSDYTVSATVDRRFYFKEQFRLQGELVKLQEGCMSGEAIDTRTRSIRRGSGHGTSERWFG
jgi:hypothetical protein